AGHVTGVQTCALPIYPEHFQPFREGGLRLGFSLRRGQGGNAGLNTGDGGRRRAKRRARERDLPGASHGNANVEGARRGPGKENGRQHGGATGGLSEWFVAGPCANRRRNRARCFVPLLGAIDRNDRAIYQRRRRRGFLLTLPGSAASRRFAFVDLPCMYT